ncbi:hypothetical protein QBC34DRAFT_150318 [Podospora aff. communis PSN243]|uniref:Uncharacterized protein n=1 Tax=Podospora aff. communis PSN243 TaxID=3040156 RepID=A0AAV9GDB6_9PEZI|nr:hypothetical protein QBC34DRAFT_150318 [Podospora aff. communis PSN243]
MTFPAKSGLMSNIRCPGYRGYSRAHLQLITMSSPGKWHGDDGGNGELCSEVHRSDIANALRLLDINAQDAFPVSFFSIDPDPHRQPPRNRHPPPPSAPNPPRVHPPKPEPTARIPQVPATFQQDVPQRHRPQAHTQGRSPRSLSLPDLQHLQTRRRRKVHHRQTSHPPPITYLQRLPPKPRSQTLPSQSQIRRLLRHRHHRRLLQRPHQAHPGRHLRHLGRAVAQPESSSATKDASATEYPRPSKYWDTDRAPEQSSHDKNVPNPTAAFGNTDSRTWRSPLDGPGKPRRARDYESFSDYEAENDESENAVAWSLGKSKEATEDGEKKAKK